MSEDNFAVGMVNYACPICGKTANTEIIMNSKLTKKLLKKLEKLMVKLLVILVLLVKNVLLIKMKLFML